ncbi:MAG TPA: hypothetical protein PLQ34_09455 [Ferrovaceae bacterium]|nr:hypothetical protein [Ferrovaceae bacterium]
MFNDKSKFGDSVDATVTRGAGQEDLVALSGVYTAECYDANGNLKWSDTIENLTTNVGRQLMLNSFFANTGGGAIVMGLMGTGTPAYTDTQASHPGWLEVGGVNAPTYSGTRKTPTYSPATSANPSVLTTSTPVIFSMTSSGTVAGAFINIGGSSTIDNSTGTLFSAGDFTAGSKLVSSGDTINVTYTLSAAG